jgi:hypothetical protein
MAGMALIVGAEAIPREALFEAQIVYDTGYEPPTDDTSDNESDDYRLDQGSRIQGM